MNVTHRKRKRKREKKKKNDNKNQQPLSMNMLRGMKICDGHSKISSTRRRIFKHINLFLSNNMRYRASSFHWMFNVFLWCWFFFSSLFLLLLFRTLWIRHSQTSTWFPLNNSQSVAPFRTSKCKSIKIELTQIPKKTQPRLDVMIELHGAKKHKTKQNTFRFRFQFSKVIDSCVSVSLVVFRSQFSHE